MIQFYLIFLIFGIVPAEPNPNQWCPAGGLIADSDGSCLVALRNQLGTDLISHADASKQCRSYSPEYQLPSVKTPEKNREFDSWFLMHPLRIRSGQAQFNVWLNLEREFTSDAKNLTNWRRRTEWRWRDGDPNVTDASVSETMWRMWERNEPNNAGDKDYCVYQYFDFKMHKEVWYDASCYKDLNTFSVIVCEKKAPNPMPTTTTTTTVTMTTTSTPISTTSTTESTLSTVVSIQSTLSPNATITETSAFQLITLMPPAAIAVLVILYVLGAVIFIAALYFLITAKRRLRDGDGKAHYNMGSINVDL